MAPPRIFVFFNISTHTFTSEYDQQKDLRSLRHPLISPHFSKILFKLGYAFESPEIEREKPPGSLQARHLWLSLPTTPSTIVPGDIPPPSLFAS